MFLGIHVKSNGETVKGLYNKDNPCPVEPKKYETKKGTEWDFEPQIDFFLEQYNNSVPIKELKGNRDTGVRQDDLAESMGMLKEKGYEVKTTKDDELPF